MRLEKITLDGFKSFADKTEFHFDAPITAVVGPNGCGKSNIVDAVKWVLGEQSTKSLRSGQMADVIFSGSSSRKGLGCAVVSLSISGTSGELPIEGDEVEISRRIFKSGECEYRINGKISRLRDIRELFMDTGIAAKAYSIIEQGQVDQLVTASKNDRRILFEEAAGISKYKAHKKEALRKLEHTENNLLRLADILGEVTKRLRSVKLAAGKARNYLQYSQRLKELQVNYSLAEYAKNHEARLEKESILGGAEEEFAIVAAEVAKNDALLSELGDRIIDTENRINHADNNLVSVESKIEQELQRIEFLRERTSELSQRRAGAGERVAKLREQQRELDNDLKRCKGERERGKVELEEKSESAGKLEAEISVLNSQCASLEADLSDEKSGIIDIVRKTAQLHNEIQSISLYRNNLSNQKDRLAGRAEKAGAELEELLTEKAQHKARLEDIEQVIGDLEESLEAKREEREQLEKKLESDSARLAHSKEARSALSSELSILSDMEARREGLGGAVKKILAGRGGGKYKYIEGVLADIIVADVEYATAVEAAVEGKGGAIVVNDKAKLLGDSEVRDRLDGRVGFVCIDEIEPFVDGTDLSKFDGVIGRGVEFVRYEGKYAPLIWKLLGKTLVVDSVERGSDLAEVLGESYSFVTVEGDFLGANGWIRFGPLGKAAGLISRKSRLRQLQETIEKMEVEIRQIQEQLELDNQSREHLEKLCKDLRTAIYEANTEKTQVNSKLSSYEENIKRLREEQPLISGEIDLLEEQIAGSVKKEYNSKQKLDEIEEVNKQRGAKIAELEDEFALKKKQQESLSSELTDLKVGLGQGRAHQQAILQTIGSVEAQIETNLSTIKAAGEEIDSCGEQEGQAQRDILSCEAKVSELFVQKEQSQHVSRALHGEIEEMLARREQTERLIREKRAQESEVEQRINELKVEIGQLEVREQSLIERVAEDLGMDLVEAFKEYEGHSVEWEQVREEIAELRAKIERLGNVNVDAIDEQEELEKRYEFLATQVEDLNKSKGQLQQLINRLNKKSREKFLETFEQIRGHFQQIFRKLFGGGRADIILEDAEDVLEAGIEIIARPPGKETRSISLLSGGEKTLTAIAMLFGVFKTKPSPFCLLDEVDAALDEANNERFNLLLKEFQKQSQFIIITHAKRTMSIADVLYGVTMQTRGVSKKIGVHFDQYEPEEQAVA